MTNTLKIQFLPKKHFWILYFDIKDRMDSQNYRYDDDTLIYIKAKEFGITPNYLAIKPLKIPLEQINQADQYYINKIKKYDAKYEYINLYQIIIDNIVKGLNLNEIAAKMQKYTNVKSKILTKKDILLVYDLEFEKEDRLNFTLGREYAITNTHNFEKSVKYIADIAQNSQNIIEEVFDYETLNASAIKITRKRLYIHYDSDNTQADLMFSYLNSNSNIPLIRLKNGPIKIYNNYQINVDIDLITNSNADITAVVIIDTHNIILNIYTYKRMIVADIKSDIDQKVLMDVIGSFKMFNNIKIDEIKDYIGNFNLYGFDYNDILFGFAIMNEALFKDIFYINEKDTYLFSTKTETGSSVQYHMNSIGIFYDKARYKQYTKNESIIRFSLSKERHTTTERVTFVKKNQLIEKTPPNLEHIKVNFSRANNIKTVYLLRLYLPHILRHYLSLENSISRIYRSYGLKFKAGIAERVSASETREITEFRQFDFYDTTKGYTSVCPLNKRPKILSVSEYEQLTATGVDNKSIAKLKNKQNQTKYLYCPYEKHSKILFENNKPCCYTPNYQPKKKRKSVKYNIEPQNIFFDFLEVFRAGKYEGVNCSIYDVNINIDIEMSIFKCISKALDLKITSTQLKELLSQSVNKIAQMELKYNINIFILEDNSKLAFKRRNSKIDLKKASVVIIEKKTKNDVKIQYLRYNNSISKFNTEYTRIFHRLYQQEHESLLITPQTTIADIDQKLDYHTYFKPINTKYKAQILDAQGNTRVIILKKPAFEYDVYVCIEATASNPISGKIVNVDNPILPPYRYIKTFFEYEASAQSIDLDGNVIGLWYYFNNIPNSVYLPIKSTKLKLKLEIKAPMYLFKHQTSEIDSYHQIKHQSKNILILIAYLYSVSALSLKEFSKYLRIDKNIKEYDLSNLKGMLSIENKNLKTELQKYEKIVPTLIKNGKIRLQNENMLKGVKYFLQKYDQNKIYYQDRLNFEIITAKNELIFNSEVDLNNWINSKYKYVIQNNLRLLEREYKSKNPIIYRNNGYYLIQTVKAGLFERALTVAYEWRLKRINLGFDAAEFTFQKERGILEIPNHIILNLNQYYQIEFFDESKDILRFVYYAGGKFAAVLPLITG